jgi:hypothetical protein
VSRLLFINAVSFAADLMWMSVTQIGSILEYFTKRLNGSALRTGKNLKGSGGELI